MNSLLDDPLFTIERNGERQQTSLPELFVYLSDKDAPALSYVHLMAHQEHIWHVFLVHLAAGVAQQQGVDAGVLLSSDAAWWRQALVRLAGFEEAWCLVVADLGKPAFMQPPVPEGDLKKFKGVCDSPSDIDVVITSKNHELKLRRLGQGSPEHWVYALVALQTSEGFLGRGNYGVARMNGGFGSRPVIGWAASSSPIHRFRRDVALAIDDRKRDLELYAKNGGHSLLWTLPWDGTESLSLAKCDRYFVEICRRIRFDRTDHLLRAATNCERLAAKELNGVLDDLWTPVLPSDNKSLTVDASGFSYRRMAKLLDQDEVQLPPSMKPREEDGDAPTLLAAVLSRGQGKTELLSIREMRVSRAAQKFSFGAPRRRSATLRASPHAARVRRHRPAQGSAPCAVRPAAARSRQAGPQRRRHCSLTGAHDIFVEQHFFKSLWEGVQKEEAEHLAAWETLLFEEAQRVLAKAIKSTAIPAADRMRVIVAAEQTLRGSAKKLTYRQDALEALEEEKRLKEQAPSAAPSAVPATRNES